MRTHCYTRALKCRGIVSALLWAVAFKHIRVPTSWRQAATGEPFGQQCEATAAFGIFMS